MLLPGQQGRMQSSRPDGDRLRQDRRGGSETLRDRARAHNVMPCARGLCSSLMMCDLVNDCDGSESSMSPTAAYQILANVPEFCTEEMADHTFALLLSIVRKLPQMGQAVRDGRWRCASPGSPPSIWPLHALSGTVHIGQGFANRMRVYPAAARDHFGAGRVWRLWPGGGSPWKGLRDGGLPIR